ncbi:hypothetical protein [Oceanibium sediminis]|uniref:hypothetical protein n=1 Tax=Oceanibium sediminis TaxID=2026339 RepID=UPI000DD34B5A|nr:hypothetical protein [Oceanibium sediminis]
MFEFGDLTEEEASSRRRAMVDRVLIALIDDRHRQIMKAYNLSEDFMATAPAPRGGACVAAAAARARAASGRAGRCDDGR